MTRGYTNHLRQVLLVLTVFAVPLCRGSDQDEIDRLKGLIERTESPERLGRLKQDAKLYEEYVRWVSSAGTMYHRRMLERLVGYRAIDEWGAFLIEPFAEANLREVLRWRAHTDERLRYVVYRILHLIVEDQGTPWRVAKEEIAPLLLEKQQTPDPTDAINEVIREGLLAVEWRSWLQQGKETAVSRLAALPNGTTAYVLKLLSLTSVPAAIDTLRERTAGLEHGRTFVDIASLRYELSSTSRDSAHLLAEWANKEQNTTGVRVYALWTLTSRASPENVELIYRCCRELASTPHPPLSREMKEVLARLEGNDALAAGLRHAVELHGRIP